MNRAPESFDNTTTDVPMALEKFTISPPTADVEIYEHEQQRKEAQDKWL